MLCLPDPAASPTQFLSSYPLPMFAHLLTYSSRTQHAAAVPAIAAFLRQHASHIPTLSLPLPLCSLHLCAPGNQSTSAGPADPTNMEIDQQNATSLPIANPAVDTAIAVAQPASLADQNPAAAAPQPASALPSAAAQPLAIPAPAVAVPALLNVAAASFVPAPAPDTLALFPAPPTPTESYTLLRARLRMAELRAETAETALVIASLSPAPVLPPPPLPPSAPSYLAAATPPVFNTDALADLLELVESTPAYQFHINDSNFVPMPKMTQQAANLVHVKKGLKQFGLTTVTSAAAIEAAYQQHLIAATSTRSASVDALRASLPSFVMGLLLEAPHQPACLDAVQLLGPLVSETLTVSSAAALAYFGKKSLQVTDANNVVSTTPLPPTLACAQPPAIRPRPVTINLTQSTQPDHAAHAAPAAQPDQAAQPDLVARTHNAPHLPYSAWPPAPLPRPAQPSQALAVYAAQPVAQTTVPIFSPLSDNSAVFNPLSVGSMPNVRHVPAPLPWDPENTKLPPAKQWLESFAEFCSLQSWDMPRMMLYFTAHSAKVWYTQILAFCSDNVITMTIPYLTAQFLKQYNTSLYSEPEMARHHLFNNQVRLTNVLHIDAYILKFRTVMREARDISSTDQIMWFLRGLPTDVHRAVAMQPLSNASWPDVDSLILFTQGHLRRAAFDPNLPSIAYAQVEDPSVKRPASSPPTPQPNQKKGKPSYPAKSTPTPSSTRPTTQSAHKSPADAFTPADDSVESRALLKTVVCKADITQPPDAWVKKGVPANRAYKLKNRLLGVCGRCKSLEHVDLPLAGKKCTAAVAVEWPDAYTRKCSGQPLARAAARLWAHLDSVPGGLQGLPGC